MDRQAHREQVARIIANSAGDEVLLKWLGKGEAFPAAIQREIPKPSRALEDVGRQTLELVTIARAVRGVETDELMFAGELPREGQHFTDLAGRRYRIEEDRSVSHGAAFVFACSASAA